MNVFKIILILVLVPVMFVNCSRSEDEFGDHGPVTIEFGTVCGWCGGEEKITISSVKVDYLRNIPCGENKGTISKTDITDSYDWNEIISSFDYDYFLTLDYNQCNVCVDGCDEFIIVTKEDSSHEIRYTPSAEIEGLDELRQLLINQMEKLKAYR